MALGTGGGALTDYRAGFAIGTVDHPIDFGANIGSIDSDGKWEGDPYYKEERRCQNDRSRNQRVGKPIH